MREGGRAAWPCPPRACLRGCSRPTKTNPEPSPMAAARLIPSAAGAGKRTLNGAAHRGCCHHAKNPVNPLNSPVSACRHCSGTASARPCCEGLSRPESSFYAQGPCRG